MRQMPAFSSIISILASLSHYHRINNTWAWNRSPQEIPTICLQILGQTSKALLYALRHSHSKHSKHLWAASMQASIPQMQQARASWSEMDSSISFPPLSPLARDAYHVYGAHCLYPTLALHLIFKEQMDLVSYSHHWHGLPVPAWLSGGNQGRGN